MNIIPSMKSIVVLSPTVNFRLKMIPFVTLLQYTIITCELLGFQF